jgi:hypothetical protein
MRTTIQELEDGGPPCKEDHRAPHGFLRNASHNADRYVCECEFWSPPEESTEISAEREACARACEAWAADHAQADGCQYEDCDFVAAAIDCAAAIRARGTPQPPALSTKTHLKES